MEVRSRLTLPDVTRMSRTRRLLRYLRNRGVLCLALLRGINMSWETVLRVLVVRVGLCLLGDLMWLLVWLLWLLLLLLLLVRGGERLLLRDRLLVLSELLDGGGCCCCVRWRLGLRLDGGLRDGGAE